MAKRPTPKKKRNRRATRTQHSAYRAREVQRLRERQHSPFAGPAAPKRRAQKAIEGITRVRA